MSVPPRVSVIIPYYNRPQVIGRAVGSVLAQTYAPIEIIVVDDGSSDPAALDKEISKCSDPRLRVVHHPTNRNGAAARNTGVRASHGEIIAFLDSDDEWLPTKLEKQVERYQEFGREDPVIYCQAFVTFSSQDTQGILPRRAIRNDEEMGDYLFRNGGFVPTPALMLSKAAAQQTPFDERWRRHQDYDLVLRLAAAGHRFTMVEKPLTRIHWEDIHSSARGLDPAMSLKFLEAYKHYLSPEARSGFLLEQGVYRLLRVNRWWQAINLLRKQIPLSHLRTYEWAMVTCLMIYGNDRLLRRLSAAKRALWKTESQIMVTATRRTIKEPVADLQGGQR